MKRLKELGKFIYAVIEAPAVIISRSVKHLILILLNVIYDILGNNPTSIAARSLQRAAIYSPIFFIGSIVYLVFFPPAPDPRTVIEDAESFVSVWQTDVHTDMPSSSASNQISLPLVKGGSYNFVVHWGDDTTSKINAWDAIEKTHTYAEPGQYIVTIDGMFSGWRFLQGYALNEGDEVKRDVARGDAAKLLNIYQWGALQLGNTAGGQFFGAVNLDIIAEDIPNLKQTKDASYMFAFTTFSSYTHEEVRDETHLQYWDVRGLENMEGMFYKSKNYRGYFGKGPTFTKPDNLPMYYAAARMGDYFQKWDVGSATNMRRMFYGASMLEVDISNWDVSKVRDMSEMFYNASNFITDLNDWNVSNVKDMNQMFYGASSFDGKVKNWNVNNVANMSRMFYGASKFNANISNWDVSSVKNMSEMFYGASKFNANISNWDVSSVKNMSEMFYNASKFNADISKWDISNVTNMSKIFYNAGKFNADISGWDVSNVRDMSEMFYNASTFDKPLKNWDISNVENMEGMIVGTTALRHPLNTWNVALVTKCKGFAKHSKLNNEPKALPNFLACTP